MFQEIVGERKKSPLSESCGAMRASGCGAALHRVCGEHYDLRMIALLEDFMARGRAVYENLDRKEVRKVYLECENCLRVEHEPAEDFIRKRFNNGSVEFSVTCPTCGYVNRIIDLPVDDYEFSTEVFDLSEMLKDHDLELFTRYEQGIRLS